MRLFLFLSLLFVLYYNASAYNYLVVSPVFGYSHLKFMSKVTDTLANAGHNVIVDYYNKDAPSHEQSASVFKFFWDSEVVNNPITGAIAPMFILYNEFKPMCDKVLTDKELHDWIKSKNFDGFVAEAFDFCSLYLGDHLKMNLMPMFSTIKNIPGSYAIGEPSALNFAPSLHTNYGPDQTVWDRLQDITSFTSFHYAFSNLYDRQYRQAYSLLNGEVRTWKDILQTATYFFNNNNPYIGFPIPTLAKTVEIGGFTIDPPKHEKLEEEFDKILNLRKSTVLISFGTVVQSADMPEAFKLLSFLADHRLNLFITHGGLGSTLEVAYAGKPSLMIPIFGDQFLNAKMLSRHGGAISYDKYKLGDSKKLTETVKEAISNSAYNEKALLLANILQSQPIQPKNNLLKHAEFVARFGRVHALEPYNVHYNFIRYYMLDAYAILLSIFIVSLYVFHFIVKFLYRRICRSKPKTE
ncbi:Protein CBR-UGT-2 [Caenorhabditis briggsae]|uniref:glucuronosyltransferase n=1 Tax=Caenorhabditis briggsae TaxID=6238 RepID=A8X8N0_CAEBR|nr:Protein CBR-UGT-2 [Caenorhabditis briggsae]CAP28991.2 Protein CBR-UGT-2 [Caenorhabditis briggsae]